jgi:hypothetical protein
MDWIVLGVAKQHIKATFPCGPLKSFDDLREKGISDLRDDEAKQVAAVLGQAAGMSILMIVELANNLQNTLLGFRRNVARFVEEMGNGCDGYTRLFGHIAHAISHLVPPFAPLQPSALADCGTRIVDCGFDKLSKTWRSRRAHSRPPNPKNRVN